MSYGSHESSQYAEVIAKGDGKEAEFQLTLNCVTLGCPAQLYGPPENCYPADAAEFELDSIHLLDDEGNPVEISEQVLKAFVGEDVFQKMVEDAETEAMESGDF